jgi:hypothetical protein
MAKPKKDRHERDKEDSGDYAGRFKAKINNLPQMPHTGIDFTTLSTNDVLARLTGNIQYEPKYAYYLIEHCQQGRSIITFPASYCLTFKQVESWKQHDEFNQAILLAVSYELMHWEMKLSMSKDRDDIAIAKLRLEQIQNRVKAEDLHRTFRESTIKDDNPDNAFTLDRARDVGEGGDDMFDLSEEFELDD